jgi:DNA-binding transcriptional LysR family regulator
LLERDSRHVQLTAAGEALLREGRKTLSRAQYAIQATRTAATARLNVGFYGSAAAALLPGVLRAFDERHPTYVVSIHELVLGSIEDVLNGNVSVAFSRLQPGQTELEVDVLTHEPRLVAVAQSHRLAAREAVTYGDLADESVIVNPAVQGEDPPARWHAEQERHGLLGTSATRASSIQEILALVAAERGVCLVPSAVAYHFPRPDVTYLPCTDAEPAVISLARRPGPIGPAVEAFIDAARRVACLPNVVSAGNQESRSS